MLKRLTFTHRNPSVPPLEFGARWQSEAQQMLELLPSDLAPRRLALCRVRPGGTLEHAGVAVAWFDEDQTLAAYDDWQAARGCTASANGSAVPTLRVVVEERTVHGDAWLRQRWSDPGPPTAPLLIGCMVAAEGFSRPDFRDYWWERHRPLADRLVPSELRPVAYVHDYVRPGEPGPWAGIGELYERSIDVARQRGAWFETEDAAALIEDERRFFVPASRQVLVADQIVIKSG